MTTATRNEAAERLRQAIVDNGFLVSEAGETFMEGDLDKALAAERRATVKRIRAGIEGGHPFGFWDTATGRVVGHFLDEEAAR